VRLVGLTGGIGSGKSTVADLLRAKGAVVVDADAVARRIVEPGRPALAALAERFGAGILLPDGSLDRPGLAAIAFADDESRAALDGITWPAIAEEFGRQIEESPPDAVVVCDVALLLESDWARNRPYRAIVVVEAPIDVRLDRLESRGLRRSDAEQRMAVQATDDERRAIATHVIDNGGDLELLQRQVDALWPGLLALDGPPLEVPAPDAAGKA
jgi:dephospho-CoA kinase